MSTRDDNSYSLSMSTTKMGVSLCTYHELSSKLIESLGREGEVIRIARGVAPDEGRELACPPNDLIIQESVIQVNTIDVASVRCVEGWRGW
ncbi:hypothetical protein TNCT_642011 [Trichonephila clavata]|uniref:Uncharacterized protein n=1 Tax=Trichonephila clavata TaxID=2740835 RepID=A0A8X6K1K8_TRICU|nr:hypothetical protein TNCT_642011 [Trichonephila clavata]